MLFAQKPPDGTYSYEIAWAEWGGKTLGATCTVVVLGDSIKVIHDGNESITGIKGTIMDQGIIMKHEKTGFWIIGHSENDKNAPNVGGCSEGPSRIDFQKKQWWSC